MSTCNELYFVYGVPLVDDHGKYLYGFDDGICDSLTDTGHIAAANEMDRVLVYLGIEVATIGDDRCVVAAAELPTEASLPPETISKYDEMRTLALSELEAMVDDGRAPHGSVSHVRDTPPRLLMFWGSF